MKHVVTAAAVIASSSSTEPSMEMDVTPTLLTAQPHTQQALTFDQRLQQMELVYATNAGVRQAEAE
jgi:hypothetical protein